MKNLSSYRAHKSTTPTTLNFNFNSPPFLIKRRDKNECKIIYLYSPTACPNISLPKYASYTIKWAWLCQERSIEIGHIIVLNQALLIVRDNQNLCQTINSCHIPFEKGGGPRVVVSTAAFHARVRGSVPGLGGLKETKLFLPHPRVKVSIVGSLGDREVACSASDRQGSNFESCVWRTVSSQSSHHPQEVLLAQFSLYVHKGVLKPDSFHFYLLRRFFSHKINVRSFKGQVTVITNLKMLLTMLGFHCNGCLKLPERYGNRLGNSCMLFADNLKKGIGSHVVIALFNRL